MTKLLLRATLLVLALPMVLFGQDAIPDFTHGDQVPEGNTKDWNLGPTGARGWMYSERLETRRARQILITKVDSGSPADGILRPGDVILGVGSDPFSFDPRVEFGKAIGVAEGGNGRLRMTRWRGGRAKTVTMRIARMGKYSKTAPFRCKKSEKIFMQGCNAIARRMVEGPQERNKIVRVLNTLALLSSGSEDYLPLIKAQVQWASRYSDTESKDLCCWYYGPINMLLAEYTLATGDQTFVPDMKRISLEIVNGQSLVGSWGHRFAKPDGRLIGYGMMNAPGLPLTTSLVLARKAGVQDSKLDHAIEKSVRLLRFYVGKGCVPYGDHPPFMKTHDDNGKNGIAALMFNLLEDKEATEYFSRMSVAAHGYDRDQGHTGNFFNILWALPAVALSGPNATGQWMQEFGWYYDLARKWDGTFEHQGPPQAKKDSFSGWDSTGAFMLAYSQALRVTQITGASSGVLKPLSQKEAAALVDDGRGFSNLDPKNAYADLSTRDLFGKLGSWSPVVRHRASTALTGRKGDFSKPLIQYLNSDQTYQQLGACQAIEQLKGRAAATIPSLRTLLKSDDMWVRISAANALAGIGKQASVAIPDLLRLVSRVDKQNDVRGMQQRYLAGALFSKRTGLLRHSLKDVNPDQLYAAVRASLKNEDGWARGQVGSIYKRLSFEELKPLLPAIYQAIVEPAPTGNMFADEVRLAGMEVLAQHRIQEGMSHCVKLIDRGRWGSGNRISRCLKSLQHYGTAARDLVPELQAIRKDFASKKKPDDKTKKRIKLLDDTLKIIGGNSEPPALRSIKD